MSEYTPDKWVVIELHSPEYGTLRKVLAGWYGGFAGANSWKISSAIQEVVDEGNRLVFHNDSGSTYYCYKSAKGMSGLMSSVLAGYQKRLQEEYDSKATIKVINEQDENPQPIG